LSVRGDILDCYRILEVEPESALEEVKRSYRQLVKVWHPDRFAHDPKFAKKAQEKLKLINLAYERICTESMESARNGKSQLPHEAREKSSAAKEEPPREGPVEPRCEAPKESHRETPKAAEERSPQPGPTAKRKGGLRFIQVGIALGAIAGTVLTFGLVDWWCAPAVGYTAPPTQAKPTYQVPQAMVRQPTPMSDERVYSEAELLDIWQKLLSHSNQEANSSAQTLPPKNDSTNRSAASPSDKVLQPGNENTAAQVSTADKAQVSRNNFTVAATKDQVITFPGANMSQSTTPAQIAEEKQKMDFAANEFRTKLQAAPQIEQPETFGSKADSSTVSVSHFAKDLVRLAQASISEGNILLYARQNLLVSPIVGEEVIFLRQHGVPESVILAVSAPKFPALTSPSRSLLETGPTEHTREREYRSAVNPLQGSRTRMDFPASSRAARQRPAAPPHNNNLKR
jgi:hypothetical protein